MPRLAPVHVDPKVEFRKFSSEAVLRLREKANLSRTEVAYLVGRSESSIFTWENGVAPKANDLSALAAALDCSLDDFFEEKAS